MGKLTLVIVLFCLLKPWPEALAKVVLLMDENFVDCTKGGAKYVDYTGLEYVYVNDTTYYLNGEKILLKLQQLSVLIHIRHHEDAQNCREALESLLLHRKVRTKPVEHRHHRQKNSGLLRCSGRQEGAVVLFHIAAKEQRVSFS